METIICPQCGKPMKYLGNVSGITYTSYPVQWDDVYVCDECKIKTEVREQGEIYDRIGARDLGEYKTAENLEPMLKNKYTKN